MPEDEHYQSYQSGIEMVLGYGRLFSNKSINRTKVELKSSNQLRLYIRRSYQSYQSGIEITNGRMRPSQRYSINRTKVELKCMFANWVSDE